MTTLIKKKEVERLAREAFHRRLISGYGDGEYPDCYQIVYKGKPRNFSLSYAYWFLHSLFWNENHSSNSKASHT